MRIAKRSIIGLPTDKVNGALIEFKNNINKPVLLCPWASYKDYVKTETTYQHLYVLSDEKPGIGDWSININSKYKHGELCRIDNERYVNKSGNNCKKVIGTTDPELHKRLANGLQKCGCPFNSKGLLHRDNCEDKTDIGVIKNSIIVAYVKSFNEDRVITEVDVTYESRRRILRDENGKPRAVAPSSILAPKLKDDGTLVAYLIKDKMYSLSDMEACWNACLEWNRPAGHNSGINFNAFIKNIESNG